MEQHVTIAPQPLARCLMSSSALWMGLVLVSVMALMGTAEASNLDGLLGTTGSNGGFSTLTSIIRTANESLFVKLILFAVFLWGLMQFITIRKQGLGQMAATRTAVTLAVAAKAPAKLAGKSALKTYKGMKGVPRW